jgi:hypothetical protein
VPLASPLLFNLGYPKSQVSPVVLRDLKGSHFLDGRGEKFRLPLEMPFDDDYTSGY